MFLLKVSNNVARTATTLRLMSSAQVKSLVELSVDNEGIATVQLQRAPVNSLNKDVLDAVHNSICEAEKNKCKGLILTSGSPAIFSAGIDLMEFHKPELKRLEQFKESILNVVLKLFSTKIVTAAAINGYTGAGACVLALACEYRSMTTGNATIGYNDTAIGILPPKWISDLMTRTMGARHTEYALTSSYMFPAERALQAGLIDEVAADKADAVQKCKNFIKMYDNISPAVRAGTKLSLRQEYITEFQKNRKQTTQDFLDMITNPALQGAIDQYVNSMRQRKAVKN